MNIAWSKFALEHSKIGSGNSYTTLLPETVIALVRTNWPLRRPGAGEKDTNRKVLVPVPPAGFFCSPRAPLVVGMPIKARVVQRQEGEDPYIETYMDQEDADRLGIPAVPAKRCDIVCYSAEALLENDGERSSDAPWEIVTILAYPTDTEEPMPVLTMARNFLRKPGGTFSDYTAQEFAEAIYNQHTTRMVRIRKGE